MSGPTGGVAPIHVHAELEEHVERQVEHGHQREIIDPIGARDIGDRHLEREVQRAEQVVQVVRDVQGAQRQRHFPAGPNVNAARNGS